MNLSLPGSESVREGGWVNEMIRDFKEYLHPTHTYTHTHTHIYTYTLKNKKIIIIQQGWDDDDDEEQEEEGNVIQKPSFIRSLSHK